METDTDRSCFVIMPFGGYFDVYYREIYTPAIKAANMQPRRVDDLFGPSSILQDIWLSIREADALIAELSEPNANVFYELGLAHARQKPVVLIARTMEQVPSDLRGVRVILYETQMPTWAATLSRDVTSALNTLAVEPNKFLPATYLEAVPASETGQTTIGERRLLELEQRLAVLEGAAAPQSAWRRETFSFWAKQTLVLREGSPSRITKLSHALRDHFGSALQWRGEGEDFVVSWAASPGAPDADRVAQMASALGMTVVSEGISR